VYCENHTEHLNTMCGQNAKCLYVEAGGTYSYHCAFKDHDRERYVLIYGLRWQIMWSRNCTVKNPRVSVITKSCLTS
jgi:hypothetical protein